MSLETAAVTIRGLLFADVFADLLQLKAHCGHCVSTGPEVLVREIPLFATQAGHRSGLTGRTRGLPKICVSSITFVDVEMLGSADGFCRCDASSSCKQGIAHCYSHHGPSRFCNLPSCGKEAIPRS